MQVRQTELFNAILKKDYNFLLKGEYAQQLTDYRGRTALGYASDLHHWGCVGSLLSRLSPEQIKSEIIQHELGSVLVKALDAKQLHIANLLIPLIRNFPYCYNADGYSPLHIAIRDGDNFTVIQLLNKNKANVSLETRITEKNKVQTTPLHLAVDKGQIDIVTLLISMGADQTAVSNGFTPLQKAAKSQFWDCVEAILNHPNCITYHTNICLYVFCQARDFLKKSNPEKYSNILRLLLSNNILLREDSQVFLEIMGQPSPALKLKPKPVEEKKAFIFKKPTSFDDACKQLTNFAINHNLIEAVLHIQAMDDSDPSTYLLKVAYLAQRINQVENFAYYFNSNEMGHGFIAHTIFEAITSASIPIEIKEEFDALSQKKRPLDAKVPETLKNIETLKEKERERRTALKPFRFISNETQRDAIRIIAGMKHGAHEIYTCENFPALLDELKRLYGQGIMRRWGGAAESHLSYYLRHGFVELQKIRPTAPQPIPVGTPVDANPDSLMKSPPTAPVPRTYLPASAPSLALVSQNSVFSSGIVPATNSASPLRKNLNTM